MSVWTVPLGRGGWTIPSVLVAWVAILGSVPFAFLLYAYAVGQTSGTPFLVPDSTGLVLYGALTAVGWFVLLQNRWWHLAPTAIPTAVGGLLALFGTLPFASYLLARVTGHSAGGTFAPGSDFAGALWGGMAVVGWSLLLWARSFDHRPPAVPAPRLRPG